MCSGDRGKILRRKRKEVNVEELKAAIIEGIVFVDDQLDHRGADGGQPATGNVVVV